MHKAYFLWHIVLTSAPSNPDESEIGWWQKIIDAFGTIITVVTICGFIVTFVLLVSFFLKSRKKNVNKISCERINSNVKNKKYISDVYVEMDETQEILRSFCLPKIRKQYFKELIYFYKSYFGKITKKYLKISLFSNLTHKQKINNTLRIIDFYERPHSLKRKDEKYPYILNYISIHAYRYARYLQQLVSYLTYNRTMLVLGRAASGKTNLLVNFAKQSLIKNNIEVIYLDSKYISSSIEEEFACTFNDLNDYSEKTKRFPKLHLALMALFRKRIVIIIDALNENEKEGFKNDFVSFVNKYSRYSNIRIIASCRTEFFNTRFDDYLSGIHKGYANINIDGIDNSLVRKQFFNKYREYFNYTGNISDNTQRTICKSPLFIRIFFELNQNSSKDAVSFSIPELLSKYINDLQSKYPNIVNILNFIMSKMVEQNNYECVDYDSIIEKFGVGAIEDLINESFLVRKDTIKSSLGANQYKKVISISYDEIRDFIIFELFAKKVITLDFNSEFSAKEGVLRYLFTYFKTSNNQKGMKSILVFIAKQSIREREGLIDVILPEIIYGGDQELSNVELEFVLYAMTVNNSSALRLCIETMLENTVLGKKPNFDFVISNSDKFNYYNFSQSYFRNLISEFEGKPNITDKHIDFLKDLIDDNRNTKLNEYNLYDVFQCNSQFYFIKEKQIVSLKRFLKNLGIDCFSFYGNVYKRIRSQMFGGINKIYNNYKKSYKKEFENIYDYSLAVLHYELTEADNKTMYFKNRMVFFDSCTEVMLEEESVFIKIKEMVGS